MLQKRSIYGYPVSYEENANNGIRYLQNDLDFQEARVFFEQAKQKGMAPFEDDQNRQYTLYYQNGAYLLVSRER